MCPSCTREGKGSEEVQKCLIMEKEVEEWGGDDWAFAREKKRTEWTKEEERTWEERYKEIELEDKPVYCPKCYDKLEAKILDEEKKKEEKKKEKPKAP